MQTFSAPSHLLQMRGLKLSMDFLPSLWHCRIFYRCVDWNTLHAGSYGYLGRIFYRCVDWNNLDHLPTRSPISRIFYRCVDWNLWLSGNRKEPLVASFTDAWIETIVEAALEPFFIVASFTDAWIETHKNMTDEEKERSRIFYRCVDWNFAV